MKTAMSFRFTKEAVTAIRKIADQLGVSQTAVLEMAVRKFHQPSKPQTKTKTK